MSSPHLLSSQDGAIATLTFNRPEARNALTWEMYQALADLCETIDADSEIRVLVLSGAGGKAFAAGTDIEQFRKFDTARDGINYEASLDAVIERLASISKPIIAKIEGAAVGSGCIIAATCDLRICTPESSFGIPIARTLGNCLSATNHTRLLDLIGPSRLKDLIYTGRLLSANEALSAGLVNHVVKATELASFVKKTAETIAANAPFTITTTKEILRRIQVNNRLDASESEELIELCYGSDDFKEGVDSFLVKRPPEWSGS